MLTRPTSNDIGEFQKKYIANCPDDIIPFLKEQRNAFAGFIDGLSEEQLMFRYAPGKWTLRDVIVHIIDTELVFDYRCLSILRDDPQALPGFDQDVYMKEKDFSHLTKVYLKNAFLHIRDYSLILFSGFQASDWLKKGEISNYEMGLNAMPYMLGGHLQHHLNVIKERYI